MHPFFSIFVHIEHCLSLYYYYSQGHVEQLIAVQSVDANSAQRTAEATEEGGNGSEQTQLRNSRGVFAAKCFAVHRRESNVTSAFHCWNLCNSGGVAVEFSNNGTLLASGGSDKIVRLWRISSQGEAGREQLCLI